MAIMEYTTKNGRRYRVQVYRDGVRIAGKAGFLTKKEARTWLSMVENGSQQPVTGTDFLMVANAYLEDMEARCRRITFQYKRTLVKRFIVFMGGRFDIEDLSQLKIGAFLRNELTRRGAKTANRTLGELKTLFNWACKKNLYNENPFWTHDKFAEVAFVRRVPMLDAVEAIKAVASREQLDFLEVLLHTGARLSEVCQLNWSDVDFQNKTITLWTRKRKGGNMEPGTLPMSKHLAACLAERKNRSGAHEAFVFCGRCGRQFTRNSVRRLLPELCEAAQVSPPFTAHSLRHWFATRLKDSRKVTPFQIKTALRHKNLSTTEKYLHELSIDRSVADILDGGTAE